MEFAGGVQGNSGEEDDVDGGQNHSAQHQQSIDQLVKMQVFVLRDVVVCSLEWQREKYHNKMCHELLKNSNRGESERNNVYFLIRVISELKGFKAHFLK